jgi:tryptophan synthase beta chain
MAENFVIHLNPSDMPQAWYDIQPDLPAPLAPPLHPETREPIKPEDLAAIFPMELIKQEVSQERWIEIPNPMPTFIDCGGQQHFAARET